MLPPLPPPLPAPTLSYGSPELDPLEQIIPIVSWGTIAYGSVKFLSTAFAMLSEMNRSFIVERLIECAWMFLGLAVNAAMIVGGLLLQRRSRHAGTLLFPIAIALIVIEGLRMVGKLMDFYTFGSHLIWAQPGEMVSVCQTFIVPAMLIALLRRPIFRRSLVR